MEPVIDKKLRSLIQANRKELADNGFARKVMYRLPSSLRNRWIDWFESALLLVTVVLFVLLGGGVELGEKVMELGMNISLLFVSQTAMLKQTLFSTHHILSFSIIVWIITVCGGVVALMKNRCI